MQIIDNNKKIGMVDMDGVITDGGFLYLINQFLGTSYIEEDVKGYYFQDLIPQEYKEDWWQFFFSNNWYNHCELLPNVSAVLEELVEVYKICIGTDYIIPQKPRESKILLDYKYDYLLDNFPFLNYKNFAFLHDKSFLRTDFHFRIDDRINNLEGAKRKLLFTVHHNQNISNDELQSEGIERADDWLHIKKLLLK